MISDDEKLEELFEMKENFTFKDTVRRAKTLSIIRTITISLMTFIIAAFAVLISNVAILNKMENQKKAYLRDWFNVAMPNAYMGNIKFDDKLMIGEIDYVQYRFLGVKPIIDGSYKEEYTYVSLINGGDDNMGKYLLESSGQSAKDIQEIIKYNNVGKTIMKFYYPSVKYENYVNDLVKLDNIGKDKVIELSLSFDKFYNLEQVKAMLPKNVTLNWYWVDTFNENDIVKMSGDKTNASSAILDEYNVYGIKALDRQGKVIENPEDIFINTVISGKENKKYRNIYQSLFNTLSNGKDKINKEDLKIIGVVVSGDVETLKALKEKNYIKGATLGAVADKY